jgi:hypothetical protein
MAAMLTFTVTVLVTITMEMYTPQQLQATIRQHIRQPQLLNNQQTLFRKHMFIIMSKRLHPKSTTIMYKLSVSCTRKNTIPMHHHRQAQ